MASSDIELDILPSAPSNSSRSDEKSSGTTVISIESPGTPPTPLLVEEGTLCYCAGRPFRLFVVPEGGSDAFLTSYFVSRTTQFWVRVLMLTYCIAVVLTSVVSGFEEGYWFVYFTNMSYIGINLYLMASVPGPPSIACPSTNRSFSCAPRLSFSSLFVPSPVAPLWSIPNLPDQSSWS
jgi:hypothetical protein